MYIRTVIVGVSAHAAGSPSSSKLPSSSARSWCFIGWFASFLVFWQNPIISILLLQIPVVNLDSRNIKRS